jgi:hypothetical protein
MLVIGKGGSTVYNMKPFMNFHVANAREEDRRVVADLCNFDDFKILKTKCLSRMEMTLPHLLAPSSHSLNAFPFRFTVTGFPHTPF